MVPELIRIGDAMGGKISLLMRAALEKGEPYGGGLEEAIKYFGQHFEAVLALSAPVAVALDEMVPGFRVWIEKTKFQEDKFMLMALVEIANYLAQYRRPSDARIRPDSLPPPRHH